MAISDLLSTKQTDGEKPDERYVGMKLKSEDYAELCSLLGIPDASGGSVVFKTMLAKILEQSTA